MPTINEETPTTTSLPVRQGCDCAKTATQEEWDVVEPSSTLELPNPDDQAQPKPEMKTHKKKTKRRIAQNLQDPFSGMQFAIPPPGHLYNNDSGLETDEIASAAAILPSSGASSPLIDRACRLTPWDRNTYITYCATTPVDFHRYIWLLKCGQPECWYKEPADMLKQTLINHEDTTTSWLLPPFNEAVPYALDCPRICVTNALDPVHQSDMLPGSSVPTGSNEHTSLHYLSVVQAPHEHREFSKGSHPNSRNSYIGMEGPSPPHVATPIFKLVVNGSRESALTQAFYDAGAHGWSTLFTCVVLGWDGAAGLGTGSEWVRSLTALSSWRSKEETASRVLY